MARKGNDSYWGQACIQSATEVTSLCQCSMSIGIPWGYCHTSADPPMGHDSHKTSLKRDVQGDGDESSVMLIGEDKRSRD